MIFAYLIITFFAWWVILHRFFDRIDQFLIKISLIFFVSTFMSIGVVTIMASLASFVMSDLLYNATFYYLFGLTLCLFFNRTVLIQTVNESIEWMRKNQYITLFLAGLFAFSYFFYSRHLAIHEEGLFTSPIFWDFHWRVRLVENFALGDNFPPQNEGLAGIWQTYHYMWYVIPAIFQVLGFSVASGLTLASSFSLFFMMVGVLGLINTHIHQKRALLLVPLFVLTHGSFKIIDHLYLFFTQKNLFDDGFFHNLYAFDFNLNGRFGYNGNMINTFSFIEEPHLTFALLGVVLFIYILAHVTTFEYRHLFVFALIYGLFLQWHVYISIVYIVLGWSYLIICRLYGSKKKEMFKLVYVMSVMTIVSGIYFIAIKWYTGSIPYFNHSFLRQFPKISFDFSTMLDAGYTFSVPRMFFYYIYAYGFRLMLYISAFFTLWHHHKKMFFVYVSALSIFMLLNTVQLSPLSIYDNYKWSKTFVLIWDTGAFISFWYLLPHLGLTMKNIVIWIYILSMLSGVVSLTSFLTSKPSIEYARFDDPTYQYLRATPTRSVILADQTKYVFLAGRRSYVSDTYLPNIAEGLRPYQRERIKSELMGMNEKQTMCRYIKTNHLAHEFDYVVIQASHIFLDMKKECL